MNAVFLGALLSSRLVVPPLSPCPSVFKYEHLKEEATWIGIISVPPPPPGIPLELNIHLQIPAALPTKYVGLVELAEKQVDVARRIARSDNLPVKYKVRFPLFKPLPIVRRIYVNNQVICSDRKVPESGSIVTDINLKHSLIPIPAESYSNNEKIQDQDDEDETDINKTKQLVLDDTCGLATPTNLLMAGGRVTRHGEWPWLAAIFINNELGLQFQCSGIIISNRFIVTAGHCTVDEYVGILKPSSMIVYLGKFNLRKWKESWSSLKEVAAVHLHPDFDFIKYRSDIAVLELTDSIEYTPFIKPVCLWNSKSNINSIIGKKGTVVGWGQDELGNKMASLPKAIELPIVSYQECVNSHKEFYYLTSARTFCAGLKNGYGPCNGDSGGGLYLQTKKKGVVRWLLRGIVSLSLLNKTTNSCDLTQYTVFTDIAHFKLWILKVIGY